MCSCVRGLALSHDTETAASRWRQQRARRWSQTVFQVLQNAVRETRQGSVQHAQLKRLEKRRVYRQRHHLLVKWRHFAGERRWRARAEDFIYSRASKHSLRWCMALWISQHMALRARSCQRGFRSVCVCASVQSFQISIGCPVHLIDKPMCMDALQVMATCVVSTHMPPCMPVTDTGLHGCFIGHGDGKNPATENEACPGRHSIGRWTPGLALYARAIFARAWQTQSHSTLMVACIG